MRRREAVKTLQDAGQPPINLLQLQRQRQIEKCGVTRQDRHAKAVAALVSVGLPTKLGSTTAELSGGQQQRVAIARAIVTEPSTLFADEPTGNLDSVTTRDIMELLSRLNQERGITVLVVTHDDHVAASARRTVLIKDGRIESDLVRS